MAAPLFLKGGAGVVRKLMWFTLGFAAACAFASYFYGGWLLAAASGIVIVSLGFAVAARWARPCRIGAVICMGAAVGLCWFYLYDSMLLDQARELDGQTVRATVIVQDYSYETDYGSAVDGSVLLDGKTYRTRIYLDDDLDLEPGNRVIGEFLFYTTAGSLEDIMYYRSNGVFLLGYQKNHVVVERCWTVPLNCYPAVWRAQLQKIMNDTFDEDVVGFSKALLVGERSGIDYETSTAFKISGISHIIAVSGLHVSILFGLIYFLTGRRRVLTAMVGIPVVVIFAAIAGFSPSITRASVMQIVMMLALLFEKEYDPLSSLSFAALVMLLANPLVITSVSFQLSFACMIGIILLSEPIRCWLMDRKRLGRWKGKITQWLSSGIAVSLSASVFTVPLVAIYFGTVSLVSILTNLLTVWIVTFIFYGIMLVCLVGCFHTGIASVIAWVVAWPIRYVLAVSKLLASFPLAAVYTQSGYIVAWLVFVYALLLFFLLMKKKPVMVYAAISVLTLCICISLSWIEPTLDECRMTMLDVGQGQAILLQSDDMIFLVDCGGSSSESAADTTAEKLLSQGIDRVDGIILTHYDQDHSGGLEYLLTRIDADLLLMPYSLDENGVGERLQELTRGETVIVKEDLVLTDGDTELTVFAPISYNSGNESSMCVLFRTENCDILITGDMGEVGERLLLKYHELPQVDVLVVGHHGSKTSTSEALLEAVQPSYAFISVGENNYYGHPAQSVLDRLLEFGCMIFRTDENGTIVYRG